jgi:hypothetical protein
MVVKSLLAGAVTALGFAASVGAECTNTLVRKEWYVNLETQLGQRFLTMPRRRSLTQDEQLAYLAAVKCMMDTPPRTTLYEGVQSAYDDYQGLHIAMTEQIHFVVSDNSIVNRHLPT